MHPTGFPYRYMLKTVSGSDQFRLLLNNLVLTRKQTYTIVISDEKWMNHDLY